VQLSVQTLATSRNFHVEVAPTNAIDAFYHPYAYAAKRENTYRVIRAETTIGNG